MPNGYGRIQMNRMMPCTPVFLQALIPGMPLLLIPLLRPQMEGRHLLLKTTTGGDDWIIQYPGYSNAKFLIVKVTGFLRMTNTFSVL